MNIGQELYAKMLSDAAVNQKLTWVALNEVAYRHLMEFLWANKTIPRPAVVWGFSLGQEERVVAVYMIIDHVPRLYAKEGMQWN